MFNWAEVARRAEVTVILAHEGESLVGALAVSHTPEAATASLLRLVVCPSARSRGIGRLLLDAAVAASIDTDAVLLVANIPAEDARMSRLLISTGFERMRWGNRSVRYQRHLRRGPAKSIIQKSIVHLGAA